MPYKVLAHYDWFRIDLVDQKSKVLLEVLYSLIYLYQGGSKQGDKFFTLPLAPPARP